MLYNKNIWNSTEADRIQDFELPLEPMLKQNSEPALKQWIHHKKYFFLPRTESFAVYIYPSIQIHSIQDFLPSDFTETRQKSLPGFLLV